MTTGLFMLRAFQMGLSVGDLGTLDIGDVYDMMIELGNDSYEYPRKPTQADFDAL